MQMQDGGVEANSALCSNLGSTARFVVFNGPFEGWKSRFSSAADSEELVGAVVEVVCVSVVFGGLLGSPGLNLVVC
jgi:hypothetical protein